MRILVSLLLLALSLSAQKFPSAIATDADVYVAVNRSETALTSGIDSATLTLPVGSTAGFLVNTIVTVENERMRVCTVGGSTLTVCARGFGGTTAASHASLKAVRAQVTAEYHNSLTAEVKAIESTLGVNLANIPGAVLSTSYNFAAQSPGGSLSAGIVNSITLSPCPGGVNGSDANHYLYLSGGTGTAESVLISGGTCTSGASSGTIAFTPANSHSGAWTVRSATAGIQETIFALPLDVTWPGYHAGTVVVPDGTYTMHAGVAVFLHMVTIRGVSRGGTKLIFDSTIPNEAFYYTCDSQDQNVDRNRIGLHDLTIQNLSTTKDSVVFDGYSNAAELMSNVNIHGGRRGVYSKQTSTANFHDVRISGFNTHGVYQDVTGGQGENNWTNVLITTPAVNTTVGFYTVATSNVALAGTTYIFGMRIFGTYQNGVLVESTAGLQSVYFFANQLIVDGEAVTASLQLKSVANVQIGESWFSNGYSSGGGTNLSYAALLDGTNLVSLSNTVFGMNAGVGGDVKFLNAPNLTQLIGCKFGGTYHAMRFDMTNKPTKLILKGNVQVDPIGETYVNATEFAGLANGMQQTTMDSPVMFRMDASSAVNDFTLQNIESGATTPTKYMRVNALGCVEWLNSAHNAVISKLCDDGKVTHKTTTFSALGSASTAGAGTEIYCTDCTTASTCAGSGSGHKAVSNGTAWACN